MDLHSPSLLNLYTPLTLLFRLGSLFLFMLLVFCILYPK